MKHLMDFSLGRHFRDMNFFGFRVSMVFNLIHICSAGRFGV